jgi:hypothetical protein
MKYIEVTKHVAGRTITQRYPARRVVAMPEGELADPGPPWGFVDNKACRCGYLVCSQAGRCAPPPEGWSRPPTIDAEQYRHISGATVWLIHGQKLWRWTAPHEPRCDDARRLPTRNEAMAAALASVQPAEPTLRAGWWRLSKFNEVYQHEYARRVFRLGDEWRVMGDSSHPTLDAAMVRAEALARGEP